MRNIIIFFAITFLQYTSPVFPQWIQQTLPGDINIALGIDFIDQNHGITGGWYGDLSQQIYGVAYYTNDGGNSWVEASVPDSMRVMVEVQVIDDLIAYGAGAYNLPFTNYLTNYTESPLNNLRHQKHSEKLGMHISGPEDYRGYFVETTDGGLTWHPKGTFEDSVYYLVGISFVDQQTGFVLASSQGGSGRAILKTTDGGNNWFYVFPFIQYLWIEDIKFANNLDGIAVGEFTSNPETGIILKTSDGGENWENIANPGMSSIFSVAYPEVNTIIIGGINSSFQSAVYKSTDWGNNWQQINQYSGSGFLEGVDATQNTDYVLVCGNIITPTQIPFLDISSDGGENWNYSQFPQFENHLLLYSKMVDDTRWYVTGTNDIDSGFVLFTDNSGGVPVELVSFTANVFERKINLNWTTATELNNLGFEVERKTEIEDWRIIAFVEGNGTTTETQNYLYTDDLFGLDSPRLFYRLKQIDFDGTFEYSNVIEVEMNIPSQFTLEQNYPNPFNPSTTIKYTVPKYSPVKIIVYDLTGQLIKVLVDEMKQPGTYSTTFDSDDLSSGVYIYHLLAGDYFSVKKMNLLK